MKYWQVNIKYPPYRYPELKIRDEGEGEQYNPCAPIAIVRALSFRNADVSNDLISPESVHLSGHSSLNT